MTTTMVDNYQVSSELGLSKKEVSRIVKLLNDQSIKQIAFDEGVSTSSVASCIDNAKVKVERQLGIAYIPTTTSLLCRLLERRLLVPVQAFMFAVCIGTAVQTDQATAVRARRPTTSQVRRVEQTIS